MDFRVASVPRDSIGGRWAFIEKERGVVRASRTVGVRPAAPCAAHIDELGGDQRGGRSILAHVDGRPLAHAALLALLVARARSPEQKISIYRRTTGSPQHPLSLLARPSSLRFLRRSSSTRLSQSLPSPPPSSSSSSSFAVEIALIAVCRRTRTLLSGWQRRQLAVR